MGENQPLLMLRGITKDFAGVQALRGVDFDLFAGEINSLVGENGAGKSTLIKIIAGAHQPTSGTVHLDGKEVQFRNPHQAAESGVAVVYQETSLAPDLSVLENLYLGSWPTTGGRINWSAMRTAARELFEGLGMDISLNARLGSLSKATAQQVEIARALLKKARILILDEPGSVLNDLELQSLHQLLLESRRAGVAVVYITHRLEEVFRLADRITVVRDGCTVAVVNAAETTEAQVIHAMVGRDIASLYTRTPVEPGPIVLEVDQLTAEPAFRDVSMVIRAGEIVGLAGLVGAGRSELGQALFGLVPYQSGSIKVAGKASKQRPWTRMGMGVGYVPGDRGHGVFAGRSLTSNVTLTTLRDYSRLGLISHGRQRAGAGSLMRRLHVVPHEPDLAISALSGGNQQKALLARVLARATRLLILEEPTSGVDIGAKEEIHRLIDGLVAQGCAILIISSDLPELLGMSDRVLVMREGRLVGEFARGSEPQDVMALAFTSSSEEN